MWQAKEGVDRGIQKRLELLYRHGLEGGSGVNGANPAIVKQAVALRKRLRTTPNEISTSNSQVTKEVE
jgi:hypothetical protein